MIHIHCQTTSEADETLCTEEAEKWYSLHDTTAADQQQRQSTTGLDFETPLVNDAMGFISGLWRKVLTTVEIEPNELTLTFDPPKNSASKEEAKNALLWNTGATASAFGEEIDAYLSFGALPARDLAQARTFVQALSSHVTNLKGGLHNESPVLRFMPPAPTETFTNSRSRSPKIEAIKALRSVTGWGLRDCKDCIEEGAIPATDIETALLFLDLLTPFIPGIHIKTPEDDICPMGEALPPDTGKFETVDLRDALRGVLNSLSEVSTVTGTLTLHAPASEKVQYEVTRGWRALGYHVTRLRVPQ